MTERIGQRKRQGFPVMNTQRLGGWRHAPGAVALAALLAGCAVGPNFKPPVAPSAGNFWPKTPGVTPGVTQASAEISHPTPNPVNPQWWTTFHDPELTALEQRLAGANPDVATAMARFAESRAQFSATAANALPSLQASGSYTRELPSKKGVLSLFSGGGGAAFGSQGGVAGGSSGTSGAFPNQFQVNPFDLWQYGFDASWELDIWGQVRRQEEAARATAQAAAEMTRFTLVSAEAELARDYLDLRGTQRQIQIVRQDIGTFAHSVALTSGRARAGLSANLDVANARAELAAAQAQLPQLTARETELRNAIALLLGKPPGAMDAELGTTQALPPVPPSVPVGLPSDLLRRRPDIREAEANLHAATANVGVAVSNFFPQISLTGSFGFQSLQLSTIGQWAAQQYGVGPTITLPIFQGGRLRAELRLSRARQKEAAIAYRKTVLSAFHDVSNALTDYAAEQARRERLQTQAAQDRIAFNLATQRYRSGLSSFIDVLDAERQDLQAQQDLVTSTTAVSTDLVALYKALGGGWEQAEPTGEKLAQASNGAG